MASRCVSVESFLARDYDFLVVGGGTAGLVVATRLAESGSFSVGVLEAGVPAYGEDEVDIPAFYGRSLGGKHDWRFQTSPQDGLGGRSLPWPRGKVLGGTSALNYMTWNRASRDDYDAWEKLGNAGWGWDGLLPFFKKSETFHPPDETTKAKYDVSHDLSAFGTAGPIQVSYCAEYSPSHKLWHRTLNNLDIATNSSHFTGSNVGVWTNLNAVNTANSARSYSVNYVDRVENGAKLSILCGAVVDKIVLQTKGDRKVATGVKFTVDGKSHDVSVRKEIILSGGSVSSPQLLELSGIGNPDILGPAGIETQVESRTVGENLQEHIMLATIFEVDPSLENPDDLAKDEDIAKVALEQYRKDHSGRLTILPCSICYIPFNRIVPGTRLADFREVAALTESTDAPRRKVLEDRLDGKANLGQIEYIFDLGNWSPMFSEEAGKKYGTLLQILQYPFSVGSIHVKSASATDAPQIDPGYYRGKHGELDLQVMKDCLRFGRKITQTEPLASIVRGPASPAADTLNKPEDAEAWVVENTITDWHPVGTCSMGGAGGIKDGVVDERLRVYGVEGLRVIDASVMPLQISAHLQATIYAIAEKGSAMILEDNEKS